ncbi:MAG TPA: alpha/beta hydrolase-fold protein [Lentisphaeria bacterium]|nr:alpha/beta hydrolase-fold protein [Lentisphaeria bacterium]
MNASTNKVKTYIALMSVILSSAWSAAARDTNDAGRLRGRITTFSLKGPASQMAAEGSVYLPPAYSQSADLAWPVMYFLHGSGGVSGIKILAAYAERAAAEKICRPFIIAEIRGAQTPQCWWLDATATKSKAGTLVSRDFVQAVESRYRVMRSREGRIIAGFSMGGFGAMAQLFQHPELFATGVAYDGGFFKEVPADRADIRARLEKLFGGDTAVFLAMTPQGRAAQYATLPADERPAVDYQLITGAFRDRIEAFQRQLAEAGVALTGRVVVTTAKHDLAQVLDQCWREHFRFLGRRLDAGDAVPKAL